MKTFKWFVEDAPVNATGTNVPGTGDDNSTVVVKKKVKIFRRKKRMTEKEIEETRNYRKEYDNYHSQPEQRERNAARLRARRQMEKAGKVEKFDKKDVHHKDNNPLNNEKDNLAVTTQNWNRSEPRLRKEELDEAVSAKEFDSLKKGDIVSIEYKGAMSSGKATFKVTAKNVVGKARVEKVTLQSIKNPKGVKHFLYKRGTGVSFAQGDMGSQVISFKKEELTEAKYDLYHKTYSAAVQHAAAQAEKRGYEIDQGSWDSQITHGDRKPSTGKTVSKKIELTKGGKPQKKKLQIQVHAMSSGKYELNMYIEELEESINIQERELTDKEGKRREEIAKDLNDADFKKRYGDRWKEVKMGTATNMAKNESIVEADAAYLEKGKADRQKAKELKIAKAIAVANAEIAKKQEKVQALTVVQGKIKAAASKSEETIMSKKYLKTKPGSIEETVIGVWQNAISDIDNLTQEGFSSSLIKKAVELAKKMGGNMTGAVKTIEKMKKGLSKDQAVVDALRLANEQKVDGRKKGYKEALRRIRIRQERKKLQSATVTEESLEEKLKGLRYSGAPAELRARQLLDRDKESMVVKKNKVIVIDKKDEDNYLKKGWSLAEESLEEKLKKGYFRTPNGDDVWVDSNPGVLPKAWAKKVEAGKIDATKMDFSGPPNKWKAVKMEGVTNADLEALDEGTKEEYQKFFQAALKKFDAKSPADMDDEKKKKFFDYIDKNWDGADEKKESWKKDVMKKPASGVKKGFKDKKKEVKEGELPPALKKAIAAKKKKDGGDDDE
jgi:hypothetical protein